MTVKRVITCQLHGMVISMSIQTKNKTIFPSNKSKHKINSTPANKANVHAMETSYAHDLCYAYSMVYLSYT